MKNLNFILSLLMCFYITNIKAVIVISLGGDCTVATVLREMGLRRIAYPFDWMFSSFDAVYKSIEDDFRLFLDPATLKVADDKRIVINAYGIKFVHDFPTINHSAALSDSETHGWAEIRKDWRNFIAPIREKYQRRIERFKAALNGFDHVFLIRYTVTRADIDKIVEFKNMLITRYPNLKFTIVAVGGSPGEDQEWGVEKVKNFYVAYDSPDFWPAWKRIFDSLGINQSTSRSMLDDNEEDDDWFCCGSCQK